MIMMVVIVMILGKNVPKVLYRIVLVMAIAVHLNGLVMATQIAKINSTGVI